jgi:5-methylcytosine-specific restriction endonuclease McrA
MSSEAKHRFSNVRRRIRRQVLRTHGLTCWLCKLPIADARDATMDHVRPVRFGGRYEEENLRPAHAECNRQRGDKPVDEHGNSDGGQR